MIIYNVNAIIQLIIIAIIIGVIHLLLLIFGFNFIEFTTSNHNELNLIVLIAVISIFTHIKGIKGSLFFIPVWILATGAIYVIAAINNYRGIYRYALLWLALLLVLYIFLWLRQTKKEWQKAQAALAQLQLNQFASLPDGQLWNLVSHAFYKPPFYFQHLYPFWKITHNHIFSSADFFTHYKTLLSLPPLLTYHSPVDNDWFQAFRQKINSSDNTSTYSNLSKDLQKFAQIIDGRVKFLNKA